MSGSAILVINVLNDFLDQWDEEERAILISRTNELIDHFRAAELPIIWVWQEFEPDLSDAFLEMREKGIRITIRGTIGAQFCAELHQHDGDHFVIKKRYSAFSDAARSDLKTSRRRRAHAVRNQHTCLHSDGSH